MVLPNDMSFRDRIRQLEKDNQQQAEVIASYQRIRDQEAEKAVYMILRLEALRDKFQLSVDAINQIAEEYLEKQSKDPEMQARAAANVKEFTINGQRQPVPSNNRGSRGASKAENPPGESPARCATDGERIEFPTPGSPPPEDKPASPAQGS